MWAWYKPCWKHGVAGLLVIEDNIEVYNEVDDDLVRDMTEILTCFCARLYGRRSAAHRARQAISSATE